MQWYLAVLKQYATFKGRARRKEYWFFALFNVLITVGLLIVGELIAEGLGRILYFVYGLAVFVPSLAVSVRRLHDTDRSGWWLFISLVPLAGPIILLVFLALAGTPGPNSYGPDPKGVDHTARSTV